MAFSLSRSTMSRFSWFVSTYLRYILFSVVFVIRENQGVYTFLLHFANSKKAHWKDKAQAKSLRHVSLSSVQQQQQTT